MSRLGIISLLPSCERAILIRSLNKYSLMFREIQTTLQINKLLKKCVSADLWTKIAHSRLNVISHSIQSTESTGFYDLISSPQVGRNGDCGSLVSNPSCVLRTALFS